MVFSVLELELSLHLSKWGVDREFTKWEGGAWWSLLRRNLQNSRPPRNGGSLRELAGWSWKLKLDLRKVSPKIYPFNHHQNPC